MAYGRPAHIRSHRRGGSRRRPRRFAPWISVLSVSLLALFVLVVGYQQLLARACSGEAIARIMAAPPIAQPLDRLATEWLASEPSTQDGRCARVVIESRDSAEVAGALKGSGEPPDVWLPTSSVWVQKAAASQSGAALLPAERPSIARSPTVIAMPEPMAAALGWPEPRLGDDELRWLTLVEVFADERGWERFDHPEWGPFRLGMTDPTRSTAAVHALAALLDVDDDGDVGGVGRRLRPARHHGSRRLPRHHRTAVDGVGGGGQRRPRGRVASRLRVPCLGVRGAHPQPAQPRRAVEQRLPRRRCGRGRLPVPHPAGRLGGSTRPRGGAEFLTFALSPRCKTVTRSAEP